MTAARLHYAAVLDAVREDRDRLKAAIVAHHRQKPEDRSLEDDRRLYEAAGLPVGGSPSEVLQNCQQFLTRPNAEAGWPSYAELEAQRDALTAQLDALTRDPAYRQGALTELRCCIRLARVIAPGDLLDALLRRLESYGAAE